MAALDPHRASDVDWFAQTMAAHMITLHPLVRTHQLAHSPQFPDGIEFGWAQFPSVRGRGFSIVVFVDRWHVLPIAFADAQGRVFIDSRINPDTQHMTPTMSFIQEGYIQVPRSRLFAYEPTAQDTIVPAVAGGIVFHQHTTGEALWLASWLKAGNKYTLEQLRCALPAGQRARLDYRDAITTAYVHTVLLAQHEDVLLGFGSGNIFRRLELEAPLGAIRRSIDDIARLEARHMRVSGLERYFEHLMQQAGALQTDTGLEAVHGAEPLQLLSSPHSGSLLFAWQDQLNIRSFFAALRIETALNRFSALSRVVEYNARTGHWPIEDSISEVEAARIDWELLQNPALLAQPIDEIDRDAIVDSQADDVDVFATAESASIPHTRQTIRVDDVLAMSSTQALVRLMEMTRLRASALWEHNPDPLTAHDEDKQHAQPVHQDADGSQWIYRRTLSHMLRALHTPYRYDVEFRTDVAAGRTALGFTSVGPALMPIERLDSSGIWQKLSAHDRALMSMQYNLRLGIIVAALAFAADSRIHTVSVHIDSLGLEEIHDEHDSAIEQLVARALAAFNARAGSHGAHSSDDAQGVHIDEQGVSIDPLSGSGTHSADPKDGDIHGDPSQLSALLSATAQPDANNTKGSNNPNGSSDTKGYETSSEADSTYDAEDTRDSNEGSNLDDTTVVDNANVADNTQGTNAPRETHAALERGAEGSDTNDIQQGTGTSADNTHGDSESSDTSESRQLHAIDRDAMNSRFMQIMQGLSFDEQSFDLPHRESDQVSQPEDTQDTIHKSQQNQDAADGFGEVPERDDSTTAEQEDDSNPLAMLPQQPRMSTLVTATFEREAFMQAVHELGLDKPEQFYERAHAQMNIQEDGSLGEVNGTFTLQDSAFAPAGAQEIPELSEWHFNSGQQRIFAARDALDMAIQRDDVFQHVNAQLQRLHDDTTLDSVQKARQAMAYIQRVADPELTDAAARVTSAFIDGTEVPTLDTRMSNQLRDARIALRGMQGGSFEQNLAQLREVVEQADEAFASGNGVARYFNSYAERIVFNHMFATSHEQTVLIPDHLFMAHMDLVDIAAQLEPMELEIDPMEHLNTMVSYAPAYPLVHMRMAMYLSHQGDWASSRAACLNALRVALDRNDAAFAYYRLAYCSWMRDEFALAAACYEMCEHISGNDALAQVTLHEEFAELMRRAHSQRITVPHTIDEAQHVLREANIPVWPYTQAAQIVRDAARVSVDHAMFVPARTLCLAAARMQDSRRDMDTVDIQFLRSLRP